MTRWKAAALALAATAVLFGLGFAGAVWLTGPLVAISGHAPRGIAAAVAVFTGPFIGGLIVFWVIFGDKPARKDEAVDGRYLPSASERFKRLVGRDSA
jgi:type VI protein secretion system component VasK